MPEKEQQQYHYHTHHPNIEMCTHDSEAKKKNQKCIRARSNCKMRCDLLTHLEICGSTSSRHIDGIILRMNE